MGFQHIDNLYQPRAQKILAFREVYAMEKVHGTSAHLTWSGSSLRMFSGSAKSATFEALFGTLYPAVSAIEAKMIEIFGAKRVVVYGEAYGGRLHGMSHAYGKQMRFVAFDVLVDDIWLSVPNAANVAEKLGLDFVRFALVPATVEALDAERDRPSTQAEKYGTPGKHAEGVIVRPPFEVTTSDGKRMIAKHKRPEFSERKTAPEIDPAKLVVLTEANAIADEWVTAMRLAHVLDKLGNPRDIRVTGRVIAAMIEDVTREAAGEIVDSVAARKAIGFKASTMYRDLLRTDDQQPPEADSSEK